MTTDEPRASRASAVETVQPASSGHLDPRQQQTLRRLLSVWLAFERELDSVPVLARLMHGQFRSEDYRQVLLNLRQQVVEGSRWIARTASSFDANFLEVRSMVLGHAKDEHRDYEMLESDFIAAGGSVLQIRTTEKNIGSEALHGYLMYRAGQPNPLGLLGAMFIIEGLGQKMARSWAKDIAQQTGLGESATRFLSYHAENDETHVDKLHRLLALPEIDELAADDIVKTAKVVARLYRLQLEELDVR